MIKTTVLSAPVFAAVPTATLDYLFPLVDWLLDVRGLHARYDEQVALSDVYSASIEKVESDQVSFFDAQLYDLALGKVDQVTFLDQFDRVCAFYRDFSEIVGIYDTRDITLDKHLGDGITLSDQAIRTTSKGISDGVVFGDSQFTKSLSPKYQETVQFSDRFFLNGNSYCDFTYFAEDYVGAVRQI